VWCFKLLVGWWGLTHAPRDKAESWVFWIATASDDEAESGMTHEMFGDTKTNRKINIETISNKRYQISTVSFNCRKLYVDIHAILNCQPARSGRWQSNNLTSTNIRWNSLKNLTYLLFGQTTVWNSVSHQWMSKCPRALNGPYCKCALENCETSQLMNVPLKHHSKYNSGHKIRKIFVSKTTKDRKTFTFSNHVLIQNSGEEKH